MFIYLIGKSPITAFTLEISPFAFVITAPTDFVFIYSFKRKTTSFKTSKYV